MAKKKKHPYSEFYLDEVMENMGYMYQYLRDVHNMNIRDSIKLFRKSNIALGIELANPHYLCGLFGTELAEELLGSYDVVEQSHYPDIEYWIGWASAYLQWYSNVTFDRMYELVPADRFVCMYGPYHEMWFEHLEEFAEKYIMGHEGEVWVWTDESLGEYRKKEEVAHLINDRGYFVDSKLWKNAWKDY